jgi:hypothetical protein
MAETTPVMRKNDGQKSDAEEKEDGEHEDDGPDGGWGWCVVLG